MDNLETKYLLDISNVLAGLDKVDSRLGDLEQKLREVKAVDPFKEIGQKAASFEKDMSDGVRQIALTENGVKELSAELKNLADQMAKTTKAKKDFAAAREYEKVKSDLEDVKKELARINAELDKSKTKSKEVGGYFSKMRGALLGTISGAVSGGGVGTSLVSGVLGSLNIGLGVLSGVVGGIANRAFDAQASWQGLTAALNVSLKSQELTTKNLTVLEALAIKLPSSLNEVTESFGFLVDRGFKPTTKELSNLTGFAAAKNKTFDQLVQAVLDAEVGELERLKEFGIMAKNEGNKVSINFQGVTKTFVKGANDSVKAFSELSEAVGSDKLNAEKMKTLSGQTNNLGDKLDRIFRLIGEKGLPIFGAFLKLADKLLDVVDIGVTSFGNFDKALDSVGGTTNKVTYPALARLFGLFDTSGPSSQVELFFIKFNRDIEQSKNQINRLAAELEFLMSMPARLFKALTPGSGYSFGDLFNDNAKDYNRLLDERKQFYKNKETIDRAAYKAEVNRLLNRKIVGGGELEYGPDGKPKKPPVDATAQKKQSDLLKKYNEEKLKLENDFGRDKLEALRKNELEYIAAKAEFDRQSIEQERKAYLAVKQAAKGKNATLNSAENNMFDSRLGFVQDRAEQEKADFINKIEKQITTETSNEYQTQLQNVEYKYAEMFRLAKESGSSIIKLERQKAKEIKKIELDNSAAKLDGEANSNLGASELDIIQAQIDGRIDLELEARRRLLEIEKQYNESKIRLIRESGIAEEQARIIPLEKANKDIEKELSDLAAKVKDLKLDPDMILTKIFGKEGTKAFTSAAASVSKSVGELYGYLNQLASQRISRIEAEISAKQTQVQAETELAKEGIANNLNLRRKELNDLNTAREKAVKDQQRIQRQQLIADTATQASSMITAASKVFAGFASIPIVGVGLGTAAVALMLGAFTAAKIKAFQLVNQGKPEYEFGGQVKGKRHSGGGIDVNVEDSEWIVNRNSSIKHNKLLKAINDNDQAGMADYLLRDLIRGTGISMPDNVRADAMALMAERASLDGFDDSRMISELKGLAEELKLIRKGTSRIPKSQFVNVGDNRIAEISENGTIIRELPKER